MKLQNPFSQNTRNLFLYEYNCWMCARSDKGLELNHTYGRVSSSPVNASLICTECHSHIGHTQKEHIFLLSLSLKFLARVGYDFASEDVEFIKTIKKDFDLASRPLVDTTFKG
jgi:hypothetical protein